MPRRFGFVYAQYGQRFSSFAEYQAGAMATMDLKPSETVMGAYTTIHSQERFVVQQFSRFDEVYVSSYCSGDFVPSAVAQAPSSPV